MTGRRSHGRLSALNGVVHQDSPMPPVLGRYRNMVFHVGSDGDDPTETEREFLEPMEGAMHSLSLLPRLLRFFMAA